MGKNKKNKINVVYSTNPEFPYDFEGDKEEETLPPNQQNLYVRMEKKGRAGKAVTVVKEFVGSSDDLNELAKLIKNKCGTGGSAKDGEIIIQGDLVTKIKDLLKKEGYNCR